MFVGILVALGVFLLTYLGHRQPSALISDRNVSTVAGLGAIGTALFPNDTLDACAGVQIPTLDLFGTLHFVSATLFLGSTAVFCLVLFRRSDRVSRARPKRWRDRVYLACGSVITAALAGLAVYFLLVAPERRCEIADYRLVLWLEVVTVLAFGLSWLVKGRAIPRLNDADAAIPLALSRADAARQPAGTGERALGSTGFQPIRAGGCAAQGRRRARGHGGAGHVQAAKGLTARATGARYSTGARALRRSGLRTSSRSAAMMRSSAPSALVGATWTAGAGPASRRGWGVLGVHLRHRRRAPAQELHPVGGVGDLDAQRLDRGLHEAKRLAPGAEEGRLPLIDPSPVTCRITAPSPIRSIQVSGTGSASVKGSPATVRVATSHTCARSASEATPISNRKRRSWLRV